MKCTASAPSKCFFLPEGNTYIQLSDMAVRQAKARAAEANSAFLPDVEAVAAQQKHHAQLGQSRGGLGEAAVRRKIPRA